MKRRILIVDDEPGFTKMVKLNLESGGEFTVIEENNAMNAHQRALKERPDIVFLDILMPGADGGEVAARMRKDRSLNHVPIIFLTAILTEREAKSRREIGGFPFLPKPVSIDTLNACIRDHLG